LYWYNSRWYDDQLGRWIQPDSIIPSLSEPQSWDRYSYVFNNPVRYNDPDGHCPWCIGAVIGGVVGAAIGFGGYYAYTKATNSQFNWGTAAVATGIGAAGGALIGTGVGAAIGAGMLSGATSTALTAGGAAETANIACGGDTCASEIQDSSQALEVAAQGLSSAEEATGRIVTVIGRYPDNKNLAEKIGGNFLNTSMKIWDSMTAAEQWERNKQWLQEADIRGDVIRLASPISEAVSGSGYEKELQFLYDIGYKVTWNGTYLYKEGK
jgi:hypothetical protein